MFNIKFVPIPTSLVRDLQAGKPDAYGCPPEIFTSDGDGVPCRHCLTGVARGERYLLLAHRPFPRTQAYAETGPIFLHASPCPPFVPSAEVPSFLARQHYLIRGYDQRDRIVSGTGEIVATDKIREHAAERFENPQIAYLHVRSATNNCYHCRIDRA